LLIICELSFATDTGSWRRQRDQALTLGNYADDRMRIEYKPGPPHEIAVWWTDFKVLSVIWHDDDRAVVVNYRGGPWEWWLKRKAASPAIAPNRA
jgi:hypothetical protein